MHGILGTTIVVATCHRLIVVEATVRAGRLRSPWVRRFIRFRRCARQRSVA
jgi:hypothetical protein